MGGHETDALGALVQQEARGFLARFSRTDGIVDDQAVLAFDAASHELRRATLRAIDHDTRDVEEACCTCDVHGLAEATGHADDVADLPVLSWLCLSVGDPLRLDCLCEQTRTAHVDDAQREKSDGVAVMEVHGHNAVDPCGFEQIDSQTERDAGPRRLVAITVGVEEVLRDQDDPLGAILFGRIRDHSSDHERLVDRSCSRLDDVDMPAIHLLGDANPGDLSGGVAQNLGPDVLRIALLAESLAQVCVRGP